MIFNVVCFPFSAKVRPPITEEQEAFIRHMLEIPFAQRRRKDLVTLDTLHAYCGGPEPSVEACCLHAYSCQRKL